MEDDVAAAAAGGHPVGGGDFGGHAAGQGGHDRRRGRRVAQVRRMVEQRPLIVGVQCLPQMRVHQHHIAADSQHSARIAPV